MSPSTARRVPKVIAGVLAMAASLTALATVAWSDFAHASEVLPPTELLVDDVPEAPPVKLTKVEHKEAQLNFGRFEGY